ncbi:hypothetical protein ASE36_00185 [Rhizobium sp. Root274]|uniref:S49 family peptidase n=1 Tax=unclassified Rhizobium TaxID=2613769 RepID=UPI00071596EB|nr:MULTISPECIES: S49 family peptidase [unclassified Rhizobium]KQW30758.1 hypothetical protein ASC71_00185 [Rhizobium sp. Root1240]KRD32305.1 hypothetical protein ASE36_00185 [Rhizobium sp. Root274]
MKFMDVVASQPWALEGSRAQEYKAILEGEGDVSPQALEAYRARASARGERMGVRDGVAILNVEGPLFKKANLFVEFCGATSYEILRRDLQAALDDPSITAILLNVDSPGGEANGCDELAAAIYDARGKKPITAYVSGMAASGGYWIASAADRVVISELAVLGSIGVVLGVEDRSSADERRGVRKVEIVSSQSPGKRPDVNTEEGRTQIQTMVDDLAEVFVSAVAKHRGVSSEDVISKFGAGGVKVGAKAVASGMADEVGQFEAVLASLSPSGSGRFSNRSKGTFVMTDQNTGPTAEEIAAKATADTQARIKAIVSSDLGKTMPTLANHLAFDTTITSEVAVKILETAKADMPEKKPETGGEQSQSKTYEQQKAEAGALGLAQPQGTNASAPNVDPFAKAVANHNRKFA